MPANKEPKVTMALLLAADLRDKSPLKVQEHRESPLPPEGVKHSSSSLKKSSKAKTSHGSSTIVFPSSATPKIARCRSSGVIV
jgi:hypothetical protein